MFVAIDVLSIVIVPVVESSTSFFKKASSIFNVLSDNVQFKPAMKAVFDIEIPASEAIEAFTTALDAS